MTPERWQRIETLYQAALALAPEARVAYLAGECADDPALRQEVEDLLAQDERGDQTINAAIQRAAGGVVEQQVSALLGQRLGAWRLVRLIAQGGMGSVYLGERCDGQFEQQVAIKLLNPAMLSADALARFNSERQILARLSHPNIARLYDGGTTDDGIPYLVMEYIEGEPIDVACRQRRLDTEARLRLFQKVCAAVESAHRSLVVHRDVKPSNILVDALGEPRLLDFGVAKLIDVEQLRNPVATLADMRALTPRYASPEQLQGDAITTASDVYSLGVLLYELLTGRLPYVANERSPRAMQQAICEAEPRPPSVVMREAPEGAVDAPEPRPSRRRISRDLDNIVLMALRKEPERRYLSVALLADDIERHLNHRPVRARPAGWLYRSGKFLRRNAALVSASAVGLAAVAAMAVVHVQRITAERDRAVRAENLASEEAATARAVTDFLVSTFSTVDPLEPEPDADITARELLDRGVATLEAGGAGSAAVVRRVGLTMGKAYAGLGLPEPARALAERSLGEIEAVGGLGTPEHAAALEVLGQAAEAADEWAAARAYHEQALAIHAATVGMESRDAARVLIRLSDDYLMLDQVEEHLAAAERAVATLRKVAGPDAIETFDAVLMLAIANMTVGAMETAISHAEEARSGYERQLGPHHEKVARAIHIASIANNRLGRFREGLALAEEQLETMRAVVGPDDPRLARPLRMIYLNASMLGDTPRAYQAIRRAIAVNEAAPHPNLENLQLSYSNLGKLYLDDGLLDEAESCFRRSLAILEDVYGADRTSQFAYGHMYLGMVARERGDYATARLELDRSVEYELKLRPPDHLEVLKKRMHREYVEVFAGNHARARTGLEDVVDRLDHTAGPEHPISAQALGYLAEANAGLGRDALAEEQFQLATSRLAARLGPTAAIYLQALRAQATFIRRTRAPEVAAPLLARLDELERQRADTGHP